MVRDGFSSQYGFILACIGSAVGMGNIWRFPVLVSKYGGLTFLIPFLIFVVLIAATGVIEEFALGRKAKSGPIGAFGVCTKTRFNNEKIGNFIGFFPVIGSLALAIGYSVVMAWIFKYTYLAINGEMFAFGTNMDKIGAEFGATANESGFWIFLALLVCALIMSQGISKGIEKANKIMLPLLFGMFLILAFYVAFLPNTQKGYEYIFAISSDGLFDPEVWIFAFGQAFFSMSVAGNGSIIYGSYLSDGKDIPNSAKYVAIFNVLSAFLAAFVIIPAIATTGDELTQGGPGLMFIHLVSVLNDMQGGRVIGLIFFICVLFAGITSIINLYEAPIATIEQKFKLKRGLAVFIIHFIGLICAILIQKIVSEWMDFVSIYVCPFGALLAGIMFFWILGKENGLKAVNNGAKKQMGDKFWFCGKYIYCLCALIALIAGAILGGIG